jgi:hypothetical protein
VKEGDSIVFVVDNDSSVREAIKSLIKSVGLRVETFETVQQFMVEGPQLRREKRLHVKEWARVTGHGTIRGDAVRQRFRQMA